MRQHRMPADRLTKSYVYLLQIMRFQAMMYGVQITNDIEVWLWKGPKHGSHNALMGKD
jgi:hypothetical protein